MDTEPKPKRALSKWQIYLKSCLRDQPKDSGLGEKVKACGVQYKELKEKDPKKLEQFVESIKKSPK